MSALTIALEEIRAHVPSDVVKELESEFKRLSNFRQFGLNFERHRPEFVELWGHRVQVGQKVRVLPSREKGGERDNTVLHVIGITGETAEVKLNKNEPSINVATSNLLPIAEFGDQIFPGLEFVDEVRGGGGR